jgi:hypothetical protein
LVRKDVKSKRKIQESKRASQNRQTTSKTVINVSKWQPDTILPPEIKKGKEVKSHKKVGPTNRLPHLGVIIHSCRGVLKIIPKVATCWVTSSRDSDALTIRTPAWHGEL